MTDKIISAGFGSNRKKKRRIGASTASHRVAVWCGCGGPGAAPVLIWAVLEKKKKDTAGTPESGESYRYRYFAQNDVSVQPSRRLESESSCWLLILIKAAKIRKKKTVISNLVHTFRQNIYSLGMQKCEWDL